MSKEEILAKNMGVSKTWVETYRNEETYEVRVKEALAAMEEYAQQKAKEAIEKLENDEGYKWRNQRSIAILRQTFNL